MNAIIFILLGASLVSLIAAIIIRCLQNRKYYSRLLYLYEQVPPAPKGYKPFVVLTIVFLLAAGVLGFIAYANATTDPYFLPVVVEIAATLILCLMGLGIGATIGKYL